MSPAGIVASVFGGLFFILVVVYILNQKHFFRPSVTAIVSKLYFYPSLSLTWLSHLRRPWWAAVDKGVYVGAVPLVCLGHVKQLHKCGVRAVINLQDEYTGPSRAYREFDIDQLYLPVIDHQEPTLDQLQEAVLYIQEQRAMNHSVYIHCKGGHGRSAAVAFCYLLLIRGWDLKTTQGYLLSRRKVRKNLFRQLNIMGYYAELQKSKVARAEGREEGREERKRREEEEKEEKQKG